MEQTKPTFPTEEVTLPSKGLLYPKDSPLSKGTIEMRYMTAKHEDILTNQNYINNGTVIDKLLHELIVTPINYNDLLIGDKNALLVAARILGYGADYEITLNNPSTGVEEKVTIDLTEADDKELDKSLVKNGVNGFNFTLPTTKNELTFKILTHGDEKKIEQELKGLKKLNKIQSSELTTRLKYFITSVDGDGEKKIIRKFVDDNLLARDARALREYASSIMPDIDLTFDVEFDNGHIEEGTQIPIGVGFFWPDAGV